MKIRVMQRKSSALKASAKRFLVSHLLLEYSEDMDRAFLYKVAKVIYTVLDAESGGLQVQLKVRKINAPDSINLTLQLEEPCDHQIKIDISRAILKRLDRLNLTVKNVSVEMKAPGENGGAGARVSMCIPTIDFQKWSKVS